MLDLFKTKQNNKRAFGESVEKRAAVYLTEKGLRIIAENYLCKMGEIDIIARDNQDVIFVEVRYRKSERYGGSAASVDKKKQKRIILAADHYLQKHQLTNKVACRFDVIAITGNLENLDFNWIKAAFN